MKKKQCLVLNLPELLHFLKITLSRITYHFSPENHYSITKDYLELLPNKVCDLFFIFNAYDVQYYLCAVY